VEGEDGATAAKAMNDVCHAVDGIICCLYAIYLPERISEKMRGRERVGKSEKESERVRNSV